MAPKLDKDSMLEMELNSVNAAIGNITGSVREFYPHVRYDEFVEKLLPILQTPFDPDARAAYCRLINNASQPVLVVDNEGKVIYEIPSMVVGTNRAARNRPLGNYIEAARKKVRRNPMIGAKLQKQVFSLIEDSEEDYVENVIIPILHILADFDLTMSVPTPNGTYVLSATDLRPSTESNTADDDDGLDYID